MFLLPFLLVMSCRKHNSDDDTGTPGPDPSSDTEAGLITWSPYFPSAGENIAITFDASKGNEALKGFASDVYLYAGVITDKSTGPSDWKYVKSLSFSQPDPASKMTSLGADKYRISFNPSAFFNVPSGEKILYIAMLFRNADGSRVARNKDNSDIYMPVAASGKLQVRFVSPEFEPRYIPVPAVQVQSIGQEVYVTAVASSAADLSLSYNGNSFATAKSATSVSGKVSVTGAGAQEIKVTASGGGSTAEAVYSFVVNQAVQEAPLPAGAKEGVTFTNGGRSAIFALYAPGKKFAYVLGDFNDWKAESGAFMKRTADGTWWVQIDNLDPAREYAYQYWVDGTIRVADPYCEKVLDPQNDPSVPAGTYPSLKAYPTGKTTGIVSVMQANAAPYQWKSGSFERPQKKDLVIYELHLRDFLAAHNYNTLRDTLNYLSRLGVNAIELLPVTEFEGNSSWGYNPSFYFAPDKYYGTKRALQEVIDGCHAKGIAVIMDMVLNHSFGQSPMVQLYFDQAAGKPSSENPWFNAEARHPYNVGYDFNHESAATKRFVKNVLRFWAEEYKVDGFRFDLSKGFTQKNTGTSDANVNAWSAYDASRVAIWKEYNQYIRSVDPGLYVILEHFAADQEEQELAAEGMMLWNNLNHNFNEGTMGYVQNSDLSRAFYGTHGFNKADNLVTYMESHDEERLMFKNLSYGNSSGSYNVKDLATALKRQELAAAFFFSIPGPKMIWQFGELGYDKSIDENGRTGEKPILWNYYSNTQRRHLYSVYSMLIKLKKNNAVFASTDVQYSVNSAIKYIVLKSAGQNVVVVGNFDVSPQSASITFPQGGDWTDYFSGQSMNISGGAYRSTLAPGEFHLFSSSPLKD